MRKGAHLAPFFLDFLMGWAPMGRIRTLLILFSITLVLTTFIWDRFFVGTEGAFRKFGFQTGETVPNFTFESLDGKKHSLEEFRGKIVILNFWATFCEPCIKEIPSLLELLEKMNGNLEIIAVSGDSNIEDIRAFIRVFPGLNGKNVHIVWEKDQGILKKYQILRLPETFVLDTHLKFKKKVSGEVNWSSPEAVNFFEKILRGT